MQSTCCTAECEILARRETVIAGVEAYETKWRCLKCGHKFYVWTKKEVQDERTQEQKTGRDQGF